MLNLRSVAGLALIALGVLGILLPLMPGVPLLIAGVALLGADHPVRAFVERLWARARRAAKRRS
jgi:uncharacterized membrane protein YbaN (DUF454 family)